MKRHEAVVALAAAVCLITAGLTWKFGWYGLVGAGAVLILAMVFSDVKE